MRTLFHKLQGLAAVVGMTSLLTVCAPPAAGQAPPQRQIRNQAFMPPPIAVPRDAMAPTVTFPDGTSVKGWKVTVKQGEPFRVTQYKAVEYSYQGAIPPVYFADRLMILSVNNGEKFFDLGFHLLNNNVLLATPGGPTAVELFRYPTLGNNSLAYELRPGGVGPWFGIVPYVAFDLNVKATGKWAGPRVPNGVLPVGTSVVEFYSNADDLNFGSNLDNGVVVTAPAGNNLVVTVVQDDHVEDVRMDGNQVLTVLSADGRVSKEVTPANLAAEQGETLKAMFGTLVVKGSILQGTRCVVSLDGEEGDSTFTTTATEDPFEQLVSYKTRFAPHKLKAGVHAVRVRLMTKSGLSLDRDVFKFTVQAPPPPPPPAPPQEVKKPEPKQPEVKKPEPKKPTPPPPPAKKPGKK